MRSLYRPTPVRSPLGITRLQNMGVSVAFIGDITEDGMDELAFSAPAFSNSQGGSPYIAVFLGGTAPGDSALVTPGPLSQ